MSFFSRIFINRSLEQLVIDIIENNNVSLNNVAIGEILDNLFQENKYSTPNLILLENTFKELKKNEYKDIRYFLIDSQNNISRPYSEFWEVITNSDKLLLNNIKRFLLIFAGFIIPLFEIIEKVKKSDSGWLIGLNSRLTIFLALYLLIWFILLSPLFDRYKCANVYNDFIRNKKIILLTSVFSIIFFLCIFVLHYDVIVAKGLALNAILKLIAMWVLVISYVLINKKNLNSYIAALINSATLLTYLTVLFFLVSDQISNSYKYLLIIVFMILFTVVLHVNNILYRRIGYFYSFVYFLLFSFLNILTFTHNKNQLLDFLGILSSGGNNNIIILTTNSEASLSELYDKFIGNDLIIIPCIDSSSNFPLNLRNSMYKCIKGDIIDPAGFKHYSYRQINKFFIKNRSLLSCYKRFSDWHIYESKNNSENLIKSYAHIIFESDISISNIVGKQLYSKLVLDIKLQNGEHHLFIMNPINPEISKDYAGFYIESRQNIVELDGVAIKNIKYINETHAGINYDSAHECILSSSTDLCNSLFSNDK